MKKDIHPAYYNDSTITCASCGSKFVAGSTKKELTTEICSQCHPFYTGKRMIIDSEGRADKFIKKMEKAKKAFDAKKAKESKKVEKISEEEEIEKEVQKLNKKKEEEKELTPKRSRVTAEVQSSEKKVKVKKGGKD